VPLRAIGRAAVRQGCPPLISSRPLALFARSLVGSGRPVKRELDSQPGNRCFAARGLRWPTSALNTLARGVTGRSSGVLDLHVGCRSRRRASGSPGAHRRWKALRVVECRHRSCGPAGSGSPRSVRGKSVRALGRNNTPTHRTNFGDPKRVKRHEARRSPRPGRKLGSGRPCEARVLVL
jgi:hypothetical protein